MSEVVDACNAVDERLLWIFSLHLLQAFARKSKDETSGSSHNMPSYWICCSTGHPTLWAYTRPTHIQARRVSTKRKKTDPTQNSHTQTYLWALAGQAALAQKKRHPARQRSVEENKKKLHTHKSTTTKHPFFRRKRSHHGQKTIRYIHQL